MSLEEMERKERERREKKLYKQLEKQQKKLAAKGIHVDMDTLRKDYETQRAGGKSTLNLEAALAAAGNDEIDVVGGIEDSLDEIEHPTRLKLGEDQLKKKISPFSIESLLAKRQLSVAMASAASMKEEAEENNNPPLSSPIATSCSSPQSRASMTSPPPSTQYLSPSPSPGTGQPTTAASLASSFSLFASSAAAAAAASSSSINHELSLLKPLTACPEKSVFPTSFFQKFDPSKISFGNLQPIEPPPRSTASPTTSEQSRPQSPITEEGEDKPPSVTMSSWAVSGWCRTRSNSGQKKREVVWEKKVELALSCLK